MGRQISLGSKKLSKEARREATFTVYNIRIETLFYTLSGQSEGVITNKHVLRVVFKCQVSINHLRRVELSLFEI